MHFQLSTLWHFVVALLFLGTVAPKGIDQATLQQLSLALGLPVNRKDLTKQEDFPSFMKNIYSCFKSNPADDCLPGYHGKDVNLLRTILGTVDATPSKALHSYNKARELTNSMEISFNLSFSNRQVDTVRYAMLRLYRQPLTPHQLKTVKSKCGSDVDLSNISLQLFSQSGTIGNLSTFSLRAVHPLLVSDLAEEKWVEFLNLTRIFKDIVDSEDNVTSKSVHLRLAVHAPCSSITPTELGFVFATSKQKPQLVEFAENALQKEVLFSNVVTLFATANLHSHRSKRQAEVGTEVNAAKLETEVNAGSGDILPEPPTNGSSAVKAQSKESTPPRVLSPLPLNYKVISCQLYHFEISFEAINLTRLIAAPANYNANICAGHCSNFPSKIKNHHAYLQAVATSYSPQVIPPPCCVPKPGTLTSLSALVPGDTPDVTTVRIYSDMTATECECL